MKLEYWETKTDGVHIVCIEGGKVYQIGVLWL